MHATLSSTVRAAHNGCPSRNSRYFSPTEASVSSGTSPIISSVAGLMICIYFLFLFFNLQSPLFGLQKSLTRLEITFHFVAIFTVDGTAELPRPEHHPDIGIRGVLACQLFQRAHIVFAINGWDDDLGEVPGAELRIHHDPGDPSVAIQERMDFADQEHHIGGFGKRMAEDLVPVKGPFKGAGYQFPGHKFGVAGAIVFVLELAGMFAGPGAKQHSMTFP